MGVSRGPPTQLPPTLRPQRRTHAQGERCPAPSKHSSHHATPGWPGPPVIQDKATWRPSQASHFLGKRAITSRERSATPGDVPPQRDLADMEYGVEVRDVPRKAPLVPGGKEPPPRPRSGDHRRDRFSRAAAATEPGPPHGGVDGPAATRELSLLETPGGPPREEVTDPVLAPLVSACPLGPVRVPVPRGGCPRP